MFVFFWSKKGTEKGKIVYSRIGFLNNYFPDLLDIWFGNTC